MGLLRMTNVGEQSATAAAATGMAAMGVGHRQDGQRSHPSIAPVNGSEARPRWSVMIPTYNCAEYLRVTLKSVLMQDPGADAMQIEVIDDRSTKDDPEAVVRELSPDGRVSFYRQPENVGPQANFTSCIERARGHLVHILHGDDAVREGFYERMEAAFEQAPQISAAFCRSITIDEEGVWQQLTPLESRTPGVLKNWLERIGVFNEIKFPAIVVRRSAYEAVGGFHPELFHTSDWDMWKRLAVHGPIWYEPEALALYREHFASDTSRLMRTGANIADGRRAIEIAEAYLPAAQVAQLSGQSRKHYAYAALGLTRTMLRKGDMKAALAQAREGLKCYRSPTLVGLFAYYALRAGGRALGLPDGGGTSER
jgi:GT2 family glycosyltransferase